MQNGAWDTPRFRELLKNAQIQNIPITNFELVYEPPGEGRRIFLINARAVLSKDPQAHLLLLTIGDITMRRQAEEALQTAHAEVQLRTQELAASNRELEAFSYSVSHDLKAPLRHIEGFTRNLQEGWADKLDEKGKNTLDRVQRSAAKMTRIIDELLLLSKVSRAEVQRQNINLSKVAGLIVAELKEASPDRSVIVDIQPGITAQADGKLVERALFNLLGNAWKFAARKENARIEFGVREENGKTVYSVKDNGAGFDQRYADKLFKPFQRLHSEQEFEGTGIGLAMVERIVLRHGGKIWAEGKPGEGAAFYFTLQ